MNARIEPQGTRESTWRPKRSHDQHTSHAEALFGRDRVAADHRPQEDRDHVPDLHDAVLHRSAASWRCWCAPSWPGRTTTFLSRAPVQPVLHDARLDHALPVRHPGRRRLRQLPAAADDRRQGHGLPAHQRPEPVADPAGRAVHVQLLLRRRRQRRQAGWTEYPPLTRRPSCPGHGTDLWILGVQILGISSVGGGDQLPGDDDDDACAGHDPGAHADLRLDDRRDVRAGGVRDAGAGRRADDALRRPLHRHALLRPARRRQPDPLAAALLVLQPPGGLHHDPAGHGHRLRSHPGVLAQAALRLQGRDLRRRRHRRTGLHVSGCTTCSRRASACR